MSDGKVIDPFEPLDKRLPLNVQRQNIMRVFTYGFFDKLKEVGGDGPYASVNEDGKAREFLLQHSKTCNIAEIALTVHKEIDGSITAICPRCKEELEIY